MGFRYDESPVPSGQGIREEGVHVGSGLRLASAVCPIGTSLSGISNEALTIAWGAGGGAAVNAWTSIKTVNWLGFLPIPVTPCINILVAPATFFARFRITGFDQFDNHIVEVTPTVTAVSGASTYAFLLVCSKVFRYVENVEYMSTAVDNSLSRIEVGWTSIVDPRGVEASSIDFGFGVTSTRMLNTWQNWGFATPLRVSPWGIAVPATPAVNLQARRIAHAAELQGGVCSRLVPSLAFQALTVFGQNGASNTALRLGTSLAGWQGTPHKVGFVSSDNWTTNFTNFFTGSATRAGGTPTSTAQFGEDRLQYVCGVRSALGTRRNSNPESSYVWG